MATALDLHRARANAARPVTPKSAEPPRPTNFDVDHAFRHSEGADYYDRSSVHDSVGLAAFCFVGMVAIGLLAAVYELAVWLLERFT